jgi:protein CpxP
MSKHNESSRSNKLRSASAPYDKQRHQRWVLAGMTALMVGALSFAGPSHADQAQGPGQGQQGQGHGQRHHGMGMMGMHGPMDPATVDKRVNRMIERMLTDGTPEQKARVATIAKAAFNDLRPLREKHRAARRQGLQLLAQPTIDRAALEQLRVSQMQLAEQESRRMTQALADIAEVLTPAQRANLAERFKKRMERKG